MRSLVSLSILAVCGGPALAHQAPTGELVPYTDERVKTSPDGLYHWCSAGGSETGRTICLYVPPRGV